MITRIGRQVQTGRGFWAKANKIYFTAPDKKVQCFDATGYETGARHAVKLRKARGNWGVVGKTPKRVKPLTMTRSGAGRWGVAGNPRAPTTPRTPRTPALRGLTPRSLLTSPAGTPGSMTPLPDPSPPLTRGTPYLQTSFNDSSWGIRGTQTAPATTTPAHRWGVFWKNMGMTPVGNPQRPTPLSTIKKKQRKRRQ